MMHWGPVVSQLLYRTIVKFGGGTEGLGVRREFEVSVPVRL